MSAYSGIRVTSDHDYRASDTAPDSEAERPWILLESTRRCDRACVYCYASGRSSGENADETADLTEARTEELLDRLSLDAVVHGVTLIGGEPLLVAGLEGIVRRIRTRGVAVGISTNGLALTSSRISSLVRSGVSSFELSFDSPDPSAYRALTGSEIAGRQLVVTELVRAGVSVTVGAMLTRRNAQHVRQLLELCFALGVERVSLNQLALVGRGQQHRSLALSDDELARVLEQAEVCSASLGLGIRVGLPVEPCRLRHEPYPHLEFESCHCGARKWLIEPSGDVRTCELAPRPVGNLLQTRWHELSRLEAVRRFREQRRTPACESCADWQDCRGGCRFRQPPGC